MRALTLTGTVRSDHTLIVPLPNDIPAGIHQVIVVLQEEAVPTSTADRFTANWPVHEVGLTDPTLTFRREELYGDDGR